MTLVSLLISSLILFLDYTAYEKLLVQEVSKAQMTLILVVINKLKLI
jgi:hypothetical protein